MTALVNFKILGSIALGCAMGFTALAAEPAAKQAPDRVQITPEHQLTAPDKKDQRLIYELPPSSTTAPTRPVEDDVVRAQEIATDAMVEQARAAVWMVWVTIFSAVFTVVSSGLLFLTYRQTRITANAAIEATKLSREEFIAAHRPRFIVRKVFIPPFQPTDSKAYLAFDIANVGSTSGVVVHARVKTYAEREKYSPVAVLIRGDAEVFEALSVIPAEGHSFKAGESGSFIIQDGVWSAGDAMFALTGAVRLWIWGWIKYRDGNGVIRTTEFSRIYNTKTETLDQVHRADREYQD